MRIIFTLKVVKSAILIRRGGFGQVTGVTQYTQDTHRKYKK